MDALHVKESSVVQQLTKRIKTIDYRLSVKFILCDESSFHMEVEKQADMKADKADNEFNKTFLGLKIFHH